MLAAPFASALAVTEPPPDPIRLNLYEWMGTAPIVVAADVTADDGKFIQVVARAPIKGGLQAHSIVLVDLRSANRDREPGVKAADLMKGRGYLLLLKASTRGKNEPYPVFDLVRGIQGLKALPAEGGDATIDAAAKLAEIQERKDDDLLWATLPDFLQADNPVLVDAALDLYVKFRHESLPLVPAIQPLLEHPRPDFRRRSVLLLGRILARAGVADVPERAELVGELTGRARRDDDVLVRREAIAALARLPDPGIDETLRTISRDDPDQDVRFEAEKSTFERQSGVKPVRSN